MSHFLRKNLAEIKDARKKPAMKLGAVLIIVYMGTKYAIDNIQGKFDKDSYCDASQGAAFFPPAADDVDYIDKVTKFLVKVDQNGVARASLYSDQPDLKIICFRANLKRGLILRINDTKRVWEEFRQS